MKPLLQKPPKYDSAFMGDRAGWIYAIREDQTPLVKIGYTRGYPETRFRTLRREYGVPLTLAARVYVKSYAVKVERALHLMLAAQQIEREWFYLHISQESFEVLVRKARETVADALYTAVLYWQAVRPMTRKRLWNV